MSESTQSSSYPSHPAQDSGLISSPITRQASSSSSSTESGSHGVIPPTHPARTLVLCFDGTGDQFDSDNSNVVTLFSLLKKDDRHEQMVYYQPGIGTYTTNTQNPHSIKTKVDNLLDKMVAWNLGAHVMGGYEFLMQNYQEGDKICLFGFSRGAYTARALAGMVHKIGLLPACNHQQVPFAYNMYLRDDEAGWEQSTNFKKAFSIDVDIEFIGVWDTVNSVGIFPHTLPFTKSNSAIRVFRHALALDEHRVRFKPALYRYSSPEEAKLGTHPGDMPKSDTTIATRANGARGSPPGSKRKRKGEQSKYEQLFCESDPDCRGPQETDVLEVWFAGCHSDVGGGSVTNDTPHALARISLRWMIRECFKTNTGIRFHAELLKRIGLDPASLHPAVLARPPALQPPDGGVRLRQEATEEEHEVRDALARMYDQLVEAPYWWLLELVPTIERDGLWPHLGRGRYVPTRNRPFYVHRTVKMRMEAQGLADGEYKVRASFNRDPIWVD